MWGDLKSIIVVSAFVLSAPFSALGQEVTYETTQQEPCDEPALHDSAGFLSNWSGQLKFRLDLREEDGLGLRTKSGEVKLKYHVPDADWAAKFKFNVDHVLPQIKHGDSMSGEFDVAEFLEEGYLELSPAERWQVAVGLQPAPFGIRSARNHMDYHYNPARKPQELKRMTGATFSLFDTDEHPLFLDRVDIGLYAHHVFDSHTDTGAAVTLRAAKQFGNLEVVGSFAHLDGEKDDTRTGLGLTYDLADGTTVYGEALALSGDKWKSSAAYVAGLSHEIGSSVRVVAETTYLDEGRWQVAPGVQWTVAKHHQFGFTYRHDVAGDNRETDHEFGLGYRFKFDF